MRFKRLLLILIIVLACKSISCASDERGINFSHDSWNVVLQRAKSDGKLIFVDFYTQWCGPCLMMSEEVFTVPQVYLFYNSTFINTKIDAEAGEGIELARRYAIHSYPTYLFIDPNTGEVVHRSSSRQSPEQFIYTGESALIPERRSFYLEMEYSSKKNNAKFLIDYIEYMASIYQKDNVKEAFDNLVKISGTLKDAVLWNIFDKYISGMDNVYLKEISDNYSTYVSLIGKDRVDNKLARESRYASIEELNKLCDFEGKYTNRRMIEMDLAGGDKDYQKLARIIDDIIKDPKIDQQTFMKSLRFIIRNPRNEQLPKEWILKCVGYYQYIAYNFDDRRDPEVHQEYAACLEQIIKTMPNCRSFFPKSITDNPEIGKVKYSLRDNKLKPKPIKK